MPERKRSFRYTLAAVAQIQVYARQRMDAVRIADKMGCRVSTIWKICEKHAITLVTIPDGAPMIGAHGGEGVAKVRYAMIEVPVARDMLELIVAEAARRGTRPQHLIGRLAEVVARDDLFKAVFDK